MILDLKRERDEMVVDLLRSTNMSYREIAKQVKAKYQECSHEYVRKLAKKYGLER